ncbi:CBS domain-containing protein [Maricaulis sp.]|uniref:CBS domain-containing protein n=1 Tax=Maricaulis sp. TaxID=1486257 RepID=UPI002B27AA61|nr:CBS domain-containing protein [Maricaulis sp.]
MIVDAILRGKGRDVISIRETATLEEAARLLDSHGIGALLVEDGTGRPIAILSERDLVREMALNGAACLQRPVAQALTQAFVIAGRDIDLNALMVLMTERRVRHIPILEDDQLLGIISIGDVVKAKIAEMEAETAALQAYIRS